MTGPEVVVEFPLAPARAAELALDALIEEACSGPYDEAGVAWWVLTYTAAEDPEAVLAAIAAWRAEQ